MRLQDLKSLLVGVVLVCGVMLTGPLTSHASPADPFAVASSKMADPAKTMKSKPRVSLTERVGTLLNPPKVTQTAFDLTAATAQDFGDWDHETLR